MIAASASFLLLIAAVFSSLVFVLLYACLMPSIGKAVGKKQIDEVFPEQAFRAQWRRRVVIYLFYDSPAMLLVIALVIAPSLNSRPLRIVALLISVVVWTMSFATAVYRSISWKTGANYLLYSGFACLLSLSWLSAMFLLFSRADLSIGSTFTILFLLHFVLALIDTPATILSVAAALFICSFLFPGWEYLGGKTLRLLGQGGSMPVTLLAKSMDEGSDKIVAKPVNGCLILATDQEVLLQRADTSKDCSLRTRSFVNKPDKSTESQNSAAQRPLLRLLRSDVIQFSKFDDGDGTVDGIPIKPR